MKTKKRPVALLEVLIALSLITLCAIPLIRQPIANHQAEMAQIERIETGRIAANTFAEIREKFLKKELRWRQIPVLKAITAPFPLDDAALQLPPLPTRPIKRSYTLETLEEKQETDGSVFRLIAVHLQIGKNPFTYRLTLLKKPLIALKVSPTENSEPKEGVETPEEPKS